MKEVLKISDVVVDYYRSGTTVRAVAGVDSISSLDVNVLGV